MARDVGGERWKVAVAKDGVGEMGMEAVAVAVAKVVKDGISIQGSGCYKMAKKVALAEKRWQQRKMQ